MPQSLALNVIHLVYSTKARTACLPQDTRSELFAYKSGILAQWDCSSIAIGGVADHVHVLFLLSKNHALAKVVEEVKKGSSKWLKRQQTSIASFHWQYGYGAFSVSSSNVEKVRQYVQSQEERHAKQSFQDELRELLTRHGVPFDERYVWD